MRFYSSRSAFTLIELLVVIAIIGILASIVLVYLDTARAKSRDGRRISDVKNIQLALEVYFDANGVYPAALSSLQPTYLGVVPTPPGGTGQTSYSYAALGSGANCTTFHLGAALEVSSNSLLNEDNDDAGTASACSGSSANFNGNASDCSGSTAAGTDACYDVTS